MPTADHGLLGRLDALLDLVTRRRCLFLGPGAQLARAAAQAAADATGLDVEARPPGTTTAPEEDPTTDPVELDGPAAPAGRVTSPRDLSAGAPVALDATASSYGAAEAVEFLRLLAQAVGLLRVRGSRVEATALCAPWRRLEDGLRAGLVYAAWCHRVPWLAVLGPGTAVERLERDRLWVLRLLFGLPAAVDVDVAGLAATVAERLGLGADDRVVTALAAAFLDPLVALGVADLEPPPPQPPVQLRLAARAQTVIGSALVAAGEEVPLGVSAN
jgi:hypothetical protein